MERSWANPGIVVQLDIAMGVWACAEEQPEEDGHLQRVAAATAAPVVCSILILTKNVSAL